MNSSGNRPGILRQSQARLAHKSIWIILTMLLGILLPANLAAQPRRRSVPPPTPLPGQNVVQVVNESNVTVLLAAFGPTVVEPREGTWVLLPSGALTLDIPKEWQNTTASGSRGPRIWVRTGCRYDTAADRAQCETGDCGGKYDCGKAGLAGVAPVTISEFCFDCFPSTAPAQILNYWDVSAVDGVSITMNIKPLKTAQFPFSERNPYSPPDAFWCQSYPDYETYHPNSIAGEDLRAADRCPANFRLTRSTLGTFIQGGTGNPNDVVACFSNCGKYEYPTAPAANCTDASDPRCSAWRQYCCQATDYGGEACTPGTSTCAFGDHKCVPNGNDATKGHCPGKSCRQDSECSFGGACWNGTCACRGFVLKQPCSPDVCTNVELPASEPSFGLCSQTMDSNGLPNNLCIGDDTVHMVYRRAYTWPNDPQTYDCNNRIFQIALSPGGTSVPITNAGDIPACRSLPAIYQYDQAAALCSGVKDKVFGGARCEDSSDPRCVSSNPAKLPWECNVIGNTNAVLCRW